jgi:hypothetical protein
MNMSPGEKLEQITLCLEKSDGALRDAEFLLQNGRLEAGQNADVGSGKTGEKMSVCKETLFIRPPVL